MLMMVILRRMMLVKIKHLELLRLLQAVWKIGYALIGLLLFALLASNKPELAPTQVIVLRVLQIPIVKKFLALENIYAPLAGLNNLVLADLALQIVVLLLDLVQIIVIQFLILYV